MCSHFPGLGQATCCRCFQFFTPGVQDRFGITTLGCTAPSARVERRLKRDAVVRRRHRPVLGVGRILLIDDHFAMRRMVSTTWASSQIP